MTDPTVPDEGWEARDAYLRTLAENDLGWLDARAEPLRVPIIELAAEVTELRVEVEALREEVAALRSAGQQG